MQEQTMIILAMMAALFAVENKEYFDTVAEQVKNNDWHQIECRQVTPGLPAITLSTPTGKELVCHKLK